jgi:UDP-2,3-diacylglucosamine pyrophosphatase LpxH
LQIRKIAEKYLNQHTAKLYPPELAYQGFIVEGRPWSSVSESLWPGVHPATTSKARIYLEKMYKAGEANKLSESIPLITDENPDLSEPAYTPFQTQAPKPVETERSVILSDIHFPFEDKQVVRVVLNFIANYKPSHVFLNGDIIDFMAISHFDKDPKRLLKLQEEIDTVYEFLRHLREITGADTNIIYIEGNHENRLQRYLLQHPELSSLRSMHPRILFRLDELNIRWVSQAEKEMFHGILVTHGTKVAKWSGYTAKQEYDTYGMSGVSGHCFDEETEILTPTGWKTYEGLSVGDLVMTLNRETDTLEYNAINEVFQYDDYKELISIKGNNIDLLVTPGHGLWIASPQNPGRGKVYKEKTAEESYGKTKFFLTGGKFNETSVNLTDEQLKVLAWIMTEGHLDDRYKQGVVDSVRIAQSDTPDGHLQLLKDDLSNAGLEFSCIKRYSAGSTEHKTYRNYDAYRLNIKDVRKKLAWMWDYLGPKKEALPMLYDMSSEQARVFIHKFVDGDGCKNADAVNAYQVASIRKDHIDLLQALCTKAGYRSTICQRKSREKPFYYLTINTRREARVQNTSWSRVAYSGKVWCVSVDNGTLLVRRHGRPIITLNTHRSSTYRHKDMSGDYQWIENGCLCDLNPSYISSIPNWQHAFTVGEFIKADDRFHLNLVNIPKGKILYEGKLFD